VDISSPSIVKDSAKCILCGKCVRVCEEVQSVAAIDFTKRGSKTVITPAFNEFMNVSSCVNCGQCTTVCPTGALIETDNISRVMNAFEDEGKVVVVQHAPAVSVTIAEEFGLDASKDVTGVITAALRTIGFDKVFDTSFSADLTIMEEASELVGRLEKGENLPVITSCSPAWIKYAETFFPEFLKNVSSCKSPQGMLGAIIKSHWSKKSEVNPENIFSVAIMPCTAKKFESNRKELVKNRIADVDAVLTTREFIKLIKMHGIDLKKLESSIPDLPFGERTTAGKLFAVTGGVTEAAIRSAYFLLNETSPEDVVVEGVRGLDGRKDITVKIGGIELKGAVVSGLGNAKKILNEIKRGETDIHFLEIMSCPGGCINGGGQPIGAETDKIVNRMKHLYAIDKVESVRESHKNSSVIALYEDCLGAPGSETAHELLHTSYESREGILK